MCSQYCTSYVLALAKDQRSHVLKLESPFSTLVCPSSVLEVAELPRTCPRSVSKISLTTFSRWFNNFFNVCSSSLSPTAYHIPNRNWAAKSAESHRKLISAHCMSHCIQACWEFISYRFHLWLFVLHMKH